MRREEIGTEKRRPWCLEAVTPGAKLAKEFAHSRGKRVEELMSRELISASEDASLGEIASLLEKHRIKRVPILKDGRLVGIVSRSNLVQALAAAGSKVIASADKDRMILTAGDNPERLRSEASFASLCGVSPVPASSGKTVRHRLNRGGDRAANSALHIIAIGRLRTDQPTRGPRTMLLVG